MPAHNRETERERDRETGRQREAERDRDRELELENFILLGLLLRFCQKLSNNKSLLCY